VFAARAIFSVTRAIFSVAWAIFSVAWAISSAAWAILSAAWANSPEQCWIGCDGHAGLGARGDGARVHREGPRVIFSGVTRAGFQRQRQRSLRPRRSALFLGSLSGALAAIVALAGLETVGCRSRTPSGLQGDACSYVSEGFGPAGAVSIKVEVVAKGLEVPWALAFLPGGAMLVTERPGRIRVVRDGEVSAPVASVPIADSGEGGLLGLALHPRFDQNRLFYIYYTADEDGETRNRVERWTLAADLRSAAFERVILRGIPAAKYHDGGRLRVGPDGMLYVGTGDGREPDSSQDPSSLAGKLLRLTPNGEVPEDNPFSGRPVFLLGIRNTQGFDFRDPKTLIVTDHGPSGNTGRSGHDEVTIATAGDNLGWPSTFGCEARQGYVTPALTWQEAVPPGGAALYTGDAIPEWRGSLIVGTLESKHLHRVLFNEADPRRIARHEVYLRGDPPNGFGRLREVVMGPDRELYVTTSNCDGRGSCPEDGDKILRITR